MKANRVERHIIYPKNPYYKMLDEYCFKSKNLYNFANYQIRQKFCSDSKYISYNQMDKLLKQEGMNTDYRNMPTAQSAQQTLRLLDKNWKSFFKAIKDWSKHKEKYNGRPKLPNYLPKNGRHSLILTNMNCKLKDNQIHFPKCFNGFKLNTKINNLQQVRILPRYNHIIVEVVYQTEVPELKQDNGRCISIDIGLDNFATISNNVGAMPIILNGKGLKSINQYYNKKISHYREIAKRMNNLDYTKKMNKLTIKEPNKVIYASSEEENWDTGWFAKRYYKWTFSDGTVIKNCFSHRFYNREAEAFIYLEYWRIGDHTYKEDGTTPYLVSVEEVWEEVRYARITGENGTNYFANGLLTGDRHCPSNLNLPLE